MDPLCIPLVVDICVLQPPIATSGETASASQVLPKGPVVRACWCALGVEPWVCPCANNVTSQDSPPLCEAWGILYLLDTHFIKHKACIGIGINNIVKMMALKFLLKSTRDHNISKVQVMGDSMVVVVG
jgi:hypothetical protein